MKFRRQSVDEVSLNMTPLIDVVFLLLIFFMVSTTFTKENHLKVDLPEASAQETTINEEPLDIVITAKGSYSVAGRGLVNNQAATLERAIAEISKGRTDLPVTITADAQATHQSFVTAMDVVGRLGFSRLTITSRSVSE